MLVWNVASCYSHVMTLAQNPGYFRAAGVTPEMAAYFASVPAWYVLTWTIGVWGGLIAAFGLLLRKSWAVWWCAASQLAMVVNGLATLLSPLAREVLGRVGAVGAIATIAVAMLLVLYALAMKRRGVLQ